MAKWRLLLLLGIMAFAACTPVVPQSYDWCYRFNFTNSNFNLSIPYGSWQEGIGLLPDSENNLAFSAILSPWNPSAYVSYVRIEGYRNLTGSPGQFSSIGTIFGVNVEGYVELDEYTSNLSVTVRRSEQSVEQFGVMNMAIRSFEPFVLTDITVFGNNANPFPYNSCLDNTPTPSNTPNPSVTPFPPFETETPLPTETDFPTSTPTLTPSASPTGTLTPTGTPTPYVILDCDFTVTACGFSTTYSLSPRYVISGSYSSSGWATSWISSEGYHTFEVGRDLDSLYYITSVEFTHSSSGASGIGIDFWNSNAYQGAVGASSSGISGSGTVTYTASVTANQISIYRGHISSSYTAYVTRLRLFGYHLYGTPTPTVTQTFTPSATRTPTPTRTPTGSWTPVNTGSPTRTALSANTRTPNPSGTPNPSLTPNTTPTMIPPPPTLLPSPTSWLTYVWQTATASALTNTAPTWTPATGAPTIVATGTPIPDWSAENEAEWNILGAIGSFFAWVINSIGAFFGLIGQIINWIIGTINNILIALGNLFGSLIGFLRANFSWVNEAIEIGRLIVEIVLRIAQLVIAWIGQAFRQAAGLLNAFWNAPLIPLPGMPQCISAPLQSEVCALWYILDYTLFAPGTPGAVIPAFLVTLLDTWIIMYFVRRILKIVRRGEKVTNVG